MSVQELNLCDCGLNDTIISKFMKANILKLDLSWNDNIQAEGWK